MKDLLAKYRRSLSLKVLALVIACILVAETVVLIPSIAYHRVTYLKDRIEAAYLVSLALESQAGEMIDLEDARELFDTAAIEGVSVMSDGAQVLIMAPDLDPSAQSIVHFVDIGDSWRWSAATFFAPWQTLFSSGDDLVKVSGAAAFGDGEMVEILLSQEALRRDLFVYTCNIFILSILISSLTALFVYMRLTRTIVTPVQRLSQNMRAFEANPEDRAAVLSPSDRADEIGVAERSLAALETRTQRLLAERQRLAALGEGISKISHDLRNILASAQLMSDRLAKSDDPRVRKLSPRRIGALDRAIALSRDTLSYARMEPASLKIGPVNIAALIDDVFDDSAHMDVDFERRGGDDIKIEADSTQLYRAIFNIVKNAVEALTVGATQQTGDGQTGDGNTPRARVGVAVRAANDDVIILIEDNGAGIPEAAQAVLFDPFKGSQKAGGSGLGVAIAHEIAKAHGGALRLASSSDAGTVFEMTLPRVQKARRPTL